MAKTAPLSFVDLMAIEPLEKDTETFISRRAAFDSLGMLTYAVYLPPILQFSASEDVLLSWNPFLFAGS
jgi:hypothetical protein